MRIEKQQILTYPSPPTPTSREQYSIVPSAESQGARVANNGQSIHSRLQFKGFTDLMMTNVFLNKALFDLTASDIPWVVMANNKEERRERINRASLSVGMVFVSPIVALPFVNRFVMSKIVKLTPKLFSKNYNAIRLSNKYLLNAQKTEEGLKELAQKSSSNEIQRLYYKYIRRKPVPEEKIDLDSLLNGVDGKSAEEKYEKIRKKILTAKSIVLGSDFLLIAAPFGHVGFFNNKQTEKKTGQIGYSAELKMAEKEIVVNRAAKYKRKERIRYGIYLASLAGLVAGMPMAIKHGLLSPKKTGFSGVIKKIGEKFDYHEAIFISRLPMFFAFIGAHFGVFMASRNKTERKDNGIRSSTSFAIFFGGDLLLASVLGRLSDKFSGTKIVKDNNGKKSLLYKILPPVKNLEELKTLNSPKSVRNAKGIFWANFVFLSALMGVITPYLINRIVKKDVKEDVKKVEELKR